MAVEITENPSTEAPAAKLGNPIRQFAGSALLDVIFTLPLLVAAFLAGKNGFLSRLEPVLLDPKLPSLLMVSLGVFLVIQIIIGTVVTAQEGELLGKNWSSLWVPIRTGLMVSLLIPFSGGLCAAAWTLLWLVRMGAGA